MTGNSQAVIHAHGSRIARLACSLFTRASSMLRVTVAFILTAALTFTLVGCDEGNGTLMVAPPESDLRIVSLSPAITQILIDLGQGEYIVGVGQNDIAAPPDAAIVGTYLDVNAEQLMALRPTLVLTMSGRDGPPARLTNLAQDQFLLVNYPYPETPTDVGNIIFRESEMHGTMGQLMTPSQQPPASAEPTALPGSTAVLPGAGLAGPSAPEAKPQPSIGALLDMLPQAMSLKYTMLMRLGEIGKVTKDQGSPGVLLVIGRSPVMASGPGTVLDQLLAMAGGRNVAAETGTTAPTFDREKLLAIKPDVILIFDPMGQPLGDINTDSRLADFKGLDIPAVTNNRIVLIDDPRAMLPSSTLDRTAAIMAKAIHPEHEAKLDQIAKASMKEMSRQNDIEAAASQQRETRTPLPGSVSPVESVPPASPEEPSR